LEGHPLEKPKKDGDYTTTDYYQKFEELFPALNKLAPTTATVTSTPSLLLQAPAL